MRTLIDSCKPRPSVFDKARLDTVYNLDDLSSIHPDEFLSENYVTEGMRILLTEAFNRRKTSTPYGIWGEIAEQLNRKAVFNEFYSPLKPPDPSKWVELLRGEPVLILLDELPPYLDRK